MVMSEVRCVCDLCAIGIQQDKMCYIGVQQCFKNGVYTKYKSRTNNPPLKFEDLHEGMWVWDDKEKWYRKIVILFEPSQEHPKGSFKSYADSCETSLDFIEFKENRFYRGEVTDEKIQYHRRPYTYKQQVVVCFPDGSEEVEKCGERP